ncbi:MAG: HAMP domain-containing histidine kinase [Hyphomicrobiales bacterium]|nr:HAMP domain-containing histidine kinase [Hyphomicrobiales bacterium]
MLLRTKDKWRPRLSLIAVILLLVVLVLPLAGLVFFRVYENPLVHQTESELIAQSAVFASTMASEVERRRTPDTPMGMVLPPQLRRNPLERYHPIEPQLDLSRNETLQPRPDARKPARLVDPVFAGIGADLQHLLVETQKITLAGFRILDPFGIVIAGRNEIGQSLAHIPEVKAALAGRYASVLRKRVSDEPAPPYASISRGTGTRIFAAMPVILEDRVVGVIYTSRTPNNIFRQLNQQRWNVALATLVVLGITLVLALIFARTITGPIHELIRRTARIGQGDRSALQPLRRHGSRETAQLSQSFLDMADRLFDRTNYIANFAAHVSHELKSPLTSIQGAAELLREADDSMTQQERDKFLRNISSDAERLTTLVQRLRDMARADNPQTGGTCVVSDAVNEARQGFARLMVQLDGDTGEVIPMSGENTEIVLKHLFENAVEHGASRVAVSVEATDVDIFIDIKDDGGGISAENRSRIFDAFFTTKRETGGTGMGLGIVQLMLRAHGGTIEVRPSESGAYFEIVLPNVR